MLQHPSAPRFLAKLAILALASRIGFVAADEYAWTFTWTGSQSCPQWPCPYSYDVSGPAYTADAAAIPSFSVSCAGTVDQPVKECEARSPGGSAQPPVVSGNLSTYETSGVGAGLVAITASWFSVEYNRTLTLTGSSPLQVSDENHGTWDISPTGCPLTGCPVTDATTRRGRRHALKSSA
ncbi:hypothetical protein F4779DRAFT_187806 [Xylariaceae sp. FL0662B]|nr:hypothetical protein F4779DRAFT_187806 [Xylariaceae sp. FL0662B]